MTLPDKLRLGSSAELGLQTQKGHASVRMNGSFLAPSYLTAFSASLATSEALSIGAVEVLSSLHDFNGVPGRSEVIKDGRHVHCA